MAIKENKIIVLLLLLLIVVVVVVVSHNICANAPSHIIQRSFVNRDAKDEKEYISRNSLPHLR